MRDEISLHRRMSRTIKDREDEIIQEFEMFEDWMEKYEYIIDLGKELPPMPEEDKVESNLIKGCQSQVWLTSNVQGEYIVFDADSDALITKGLVALMVRVLSKAKPTEIVEAKLGFLDEIGLKEHLSPNRSNGLMSMIKQMRLAALGKVNS